MFCELCEILEREPIVIDNSWTYGCNKCIVCNRYYKHSRTWWSNEPGIYLLREKIAHPTCVKLLNEIKKKKEEIIKLEEKLYDKRCPSFDDEIEITC